MSENQPFEYEQQPRNDKAEVAAPQNIPEEKPASLNDLMHFGAPLPQQANQDNTPPPERFLDDANGLVDDLLITPAYVDQPQVHQPQQVPVEPRVATATEQVKAMVAPVKETPVERPEVAIDWNAIDPLPSDVKSQPAPKEVPVEVPMEKPQTAVTEETTPEEDKANLGKKALEKLKEMAKKSKNQSLVNFDWDSVLDSSFERKDPSAPILNQKLRNCLSEIVKHDLQNLSDEEKVKIFDRHMIIPSDSESNLAWLLLFSNGLYENPQVEHIANALTEAREAQGGEAPVVAKALMDETAGAQFGFQIGDGDVHGGQRATINSAGGKLVGRRAKAAIRAAINSTGYHRVSLTNSGLVAIVSAPSADSMLTFNYKVDNSKLIVGRTQGGNTYGAATHAINELITDLFIDNLTYISVKDASRENLRSLISPFDIPTMAAALVCAIYPDGVDYTRVALGQNGREETMSGRIYMPDTEITFNNRLSTKQKQFLIKSQTTQMINEEIIGYQRDWQSKEIIEDENLFLVKELPAIFNGEKITIKTHLRLTEGNIDRYVINGGIWNAYLKSMIDETFGAEPDERRRSEYAYRAIRLTALRDYSHFVEGVVITRVNEEGKEIKEARQEVLESEDIFDALDNLCTSSVDMMKAIEIIGDWMASKVTKVFGVPAYTPEEKQASEQGAPEYSHIVPLSPVNAFFTIAVLKFQELGII